MPVEMSTLSTEYVWTKITPLAGTDLTGGSAQVAIIAGATAVPVETDWKAAQLILEGTQWYARLLVGPHGGTAPTFTAGDYQEWVRATAVGSPERPVRKAGVVTFT